MLDESLLVLPLFDDHHRRTAREIAEWISTHSYLWRGKTRVQGGPAAVGTAVRRALGEAGWFGFLHTEADTDARARGDSRSICLIRESLAHAEDLADFAFATQVLAATPLLRHGSTEQRDAWLPGMARGEIAASFAVSEPLAGSDMAAVELRATPILGGYVLDGEKAWIAAGDSADVHCVIARTGEGPAALGLSAILVPADSPGVVAEPIEAIAPRSFAHLRFDGCRVPASAVIGRPGMGYVIALETLERFRMTVGAAALGFARCAAHAAATYTRERPLGSGRLADLGMVRASLADMEVRLQAAALLVIRAAWELDHDRPGFGEHSSIAKLYATEAAQEVVDATVQLFGAAGLVAGSLPECLYRQVRSLRIYEGTSEIQKMIIADAVSWRAAARGRQP